MFSWRPRDAPVTYPVDRIVKRCTVLPYGSYCRFRAEMKKRQLLGLPHKPEVRLRRTQLGWGFCADGLCLSALAKKVAGVFYPQLSAVCGQQEGAETL